MLLGEHAVLHGHPALCAAIDHRISVALEVLNEPVLEIDSSLGSYREPIANLRLDPKFKFILKAVASYQERLLQGIRLTIHSDFSSTVGFGSSAAVTVATLHVLGQLFDEELSPQLLAERAKEVIVAVQGRGSGADAAASSLGGIVQIQSANDTWHIERCALDEFPEICPVYCGYKKATAEVIEIVEAQRIKHEAEVDGIFCEMGTSAARLIQALQARDMLLAGSILNRNFQLQQQLGVSNSDCQKIVEGLLLDPDISGAKISGSGLGDCLIGLGKGHVKVEHYETLAANISREGVRSE